MDIGHNTIRDYLKLLSEKYSGTKDFFRLDMTEIKGAFRTGIEFPCVMMESHQGDFEGSKPNNSQEGILFAFSILSNPVAGKFDEIDTHLDINLKIGKAFLARMRKDSADETHFLHRTFSLADVSYSKIGPIFPEKLYGYRFTVLLRDKAILKVVVADWEDIDSDC